MTDCTSRDPKVVGSYRETFWQGRLDLAECTAEFSIVRDYDDRFQSLFKTVPILRRPVPLFRPEVKFTNRDEADSEGLSLHVRSVGIRTSVLLHQE